MWGTQLAMIPWALCGGACVAATMLRAVRDSRSYMPTPLSRGELCLNGSGSSKLHIGLRFVEIIHIAGINGEICRKLENQRASRGKKSEEFFARPDVNVCFVEKALMNGSFFHIFFAYESNICSENEYKREGNIMVETATIELTWNEIDTIAQILWAAGEEGLAEMLWDAGADLIAD